MYKKKSLLNEPERKVSWELDKLLGKKYDIHYQVSLGEVLNGIGNESHSVINSKRSDFTITGKNKFTAVAVIEHQGYGHFKNAEHAIRTEIKKTALNKADIKFIEVFSDEKGNIFPDNIRQALKKNELLTD